MSEPLPSSVEGLAALVGELRAANAALREVIAGQAMQLEAQAGQIAELKQRLGKDSATSSKPPSSDPPYRKPERRSSRRSSGRERGKQRGAPGSAMPLVDHPNETIICDPQRCTDCGADLAGAPVTGTARRQVTDVRPPPPPWVTEYRIITRACRGCAARTPSPVPAGVTARAQYGPGVLARAAELLCAHYLPVGRAAGLMASMLGVSPSTGFMAGVRARAARLLEQQFLPRVRELLRQVGVLHVDETPVRAASGLHYVHAASTEFLTAMHTGGRTKDDIDAGKILPGYTGTIVRDGYIGYQHLLDAHHAWCGAHLIRDLAAFHRVQTVMAQRRSASAALDYVTALAAGVKVADVLLVIAGRRAGCRACSAAGPRPRWPPPSEGGHERRTGGNSVVPTHPGAAEGMPEPELVQAGPVLGRYRLPHREDRRRHVRRAVPAAHRAGGVRGRGGNDRGTAGRGVRRASRSVTAVPPWGPARPAHVWPRGEPLRAASASR